MVVNFEFLGNEPIENVVTCLNYAVDKVIYFGYSEAIAEQQDNVQKFLKKYCGVTDVLFYPLSHYDLEAILTTMRQEIEYELKQGSDIYFDITGGESLILVAFGMFSKEYDTLMHIYDIPTGKLIELDEGADKCISKCVSERKVSMDLHILQEWQDERA